MPKRLMALAAGACLAAITLAVVTSGRDPIAPAAPAASVPMPTASVPAPAASSGPGGVAAAVATPAPATSAAIDGPATSPLPAQAAAAAAVLAVRTTSGPARYVDTAVADEVQASADVTIVGVQALVLHRAGDRWTRPTLVRYAVPVGLRAGAVTALARPWRLPAHKPTAAPLHTVPLTDAGHVRTATAAIVAAGYSAVREVRLSRAAATPDVVVASVRAVAPGDSGDGLHELWLTADAARVVGMPETVELPAQQEHP